MPASPSIALLIPCHNAAPYLPALAASIRALDPAVPFAEIRCHDDGSTDDTLAVARSLGLPIVAGGANRGVSHARNRLAESASTEWIHFQDADDPLLPDFLRDMAPLLRPGVDVAVCDSNWVDERSGNVSLRLRYTDAGFADPLRANLRQGVSCNSMIVRRDRFLAIGGFDESLRMWEDADLHVRLAAAGARYAALGSVASISLRRDASFSHDYRVNWNCRLQALERYARSLPGRLAPEIAIEAEATARNLVRYGDIPAAARALALNRRLGGDAPRSTHPLFTAAKRVLSPLFMLRVQEKLRSR